MQTTKHNTADLSRYRERKVVLVDPADRELGEAGLIEAHRDPGLKHRALSLFLYRRRGGKVELLLQQRSADKPVFPSLWSNTCCYNLIRGEDYLSRAVSRVREEMGIAVPASALKILYRFSYYAPDTDGWCENELDTVIVGQWDGEVYPNPDEVADYRWAEWEALGSNVSTQSALYAPWFKMILADDRFRSIFE